MVVERVDDLVELTVDRKADRLAVAKVVRMVDLMAVLLVVLSVRLFDQQRIGKTTRFAMLKALPDKTYPSVISRLKIRSQFPAICVSVIDTGVRNFVLIIRP